MKKIKSKSKKVSVLSTKSFTDKLIYLAVLLLSTVVIIQGYFLIQLWNKQDTVFLRDLKHSFLNSLDTAYFLGQNNVDYQYSQNKVIIPEQKLYLPINSDFSGLSVNYINDGSDGSIPTFYLTNEQAYIEGQTNIDTGYPSTENFLNNTGTVQSCHSLVQIYVGDMKEASINDVSVDKVFNKTTLDGRQISAFIDSQDICPYDSGPFIEYLKQIDSY